MYSYLIGEITEIGIDYVVCEVNGIGYFLYISHPNDYRRNETTQVFTYYHVKEDGVSLFGFKTREEKELFIKLIDVKGIGPKTAINILSATTPTNLIQAIETSNTGYLKKLPGIGPKAAQQIILDLKGKLVVEATVKDISQNQDLLDAREGLKLFGFKVSEIDSALAKLNDQKLTVEEYIKQALKLLNTK
jgi:Holliday junction DNA helicase RuvA